MPEYIANALAKILMYASIILPILVVAYGLVRPTIIKNVQKMDGYIYRAYIVIVFCCAAQVISSLQDIAFTADTHIILVSSLSCIFQNILFFTILKCMNGCENCKDFDEPAEKKGNEQ